jgi:NADPH-dependent 2,4-dienoyl-CoA reductase/sulfur reductase-like enzyme
VPERMIVVGGDAAGMSAASQARRRRPADDLEIVAFERSSYVSYSACGEAYYVGGYFDDLDRLVVVTPDEFAARDIEVRTHHEVTHIDTRAGKVTVRNLEDGGQASEGYDTLVYATGAIPIRPPIEGLELEGVHEIQNLDDARLVRELVDHGVERAVIVGGGYIGLEMAEAFHHRGISTAVVTSGPAVLETTLDPDMGELVNERMREMGIAVHTGTKVECLNGAHGRVRSVDCGRLELPAEVVVLGLGTRPVTELAEQAGIPLGESGAVRVNPRQQTRVEQVWAAGDCAEAVHRVSQRPVNYHLGTIANKQGRVAGINIGGGYATFPGVVGTSITKVCDLEIARTGLTSKEAEGTGFLFVTASIDSTSAAGYWPEAEKLRLKVLAERVGGRLLGAQIVGGSGAAKRIDVFATALWNAMGVAEMINLDLAYAPPFAPVWDPVLIGARQAWNAVRAAEPERPLPS